MKFSSFKSLDPIAIARELTVGLERLDFNDNFQAFEVTVSIKQGQELQIRNGLNKAVPTRRLIVRSDAEGRFVVDGDSPWNQSFVYLKNVSTTAGTPPAATVTVVFFK